LSSLTSLQTIIKARRCRSGVDLYRPAESVLKTLYHDKESHRPRQIKPEDRGVVESIWDTLNSEGTKFVLTEVDEKNRRLLAHQQGTPMNDLPPPQHEEFHRNLFYNDIDALEDAVLFPEEFSSEGINPLEIGKLEPIRKWEDEGFSLARFVQGMDLVDSDDEENHSDIEEQGLIDDESSEESSIASSEAWGDMDKDADEEVEESPA